MLPMSRGVGWAVPTLLMSYFCHPALGKDEIAAIKGIYLNPR